MPLIRDRQLVADSWTHLADDHAPLPASGGVIIALARWRRDGAALAANGRRLGLLLAPDQRPEELGGEVHRFDLIAVAFPGFADGRGFSHGRVLRQRLGFRGELRAVGPLLPDQYRFLTRVGFDTVELPELGDLEPWRHALTEISVAYQPAADGLAGAPWQRHATPEQRAHALAERTRGADALALVAAARAEFPGRLALVSSFGADSAVLLHLAASLDRALPVVFLDSGKLFPETLAYRDLLVRHLGLTDVRVVEPDPAALAAEDSDGTLWRRHPDRCCAIRKVEPLERALAPFDAWITGRKRFHGSARAVLPLVEAVAGKVKLNPLAAWGAADIEAYFGAHDLPPHPLLAFGYASIGCLPCTEPVAAGEDPRAGRWRGLAKTECGIHHKRAG